MRLSETPCSVKIPKRQIISTVWAIRPRLHETPRNLENSGHPVRSDSTAATTCLVGSNRANEVSELGEPAEQVSPSHPVRSRVLVASFGLIRLAAQQEFLRELHALLDGLEPGHDVTEQAGHLHLDEFQHLLPVAAFLLQPLLLLPLVGEA